MNRSGVSARSIWSAWCRFTSATRAAPLRTTSLDVGARSPIEQSHQGRLAVAVLAQQDDARLRVDRELGVGNSGAVDPASEPHAAQLDEVSRERAARLEREALVFLERPPPRPPRRLLRRASLASLSSSSCDVAAAVPAQRGGAGGEQRGLCVYARRPGSEARPDRISRAQHTPEFIDLLGAHRRRPLERLALVGAAPRWWLPRVCVRRRATPETCRTSVVTSSRKQRS